MMDVFKDTLRRIADRVEGARGVSLIGLDGIPIDSVEIDRDVPLDSVAAELTAFAKSLSVSRMDSETGEVDQFAVITDRAILLLSAVTKEYFLLVILRRDGNLGRARFELRKAALTLEKELV
jgi:predicted regulator of Ras-like GTPase activity (Roadblock/LC7/MglB family)